MSRFSTSFLTALLLSTSLVYSVAAADELQVVNKQGLVIQTIGPGQSVVAVQQPTQRGRPDSGVGAGEPLADASGNTVQRQARNASGDRVVTANGSFVPPYPAMPGSGDADASNRASATIDSMTLDNHSESYQPYLPIALFRYPDTYYLSDGTSWNSGAGSFQYGRVLLTGVEELGEFIRYKFEAYDSNPMLSITDYNSGDHSAVGELVLAEPFYLDALPGSSVGEIRGALTIVSNEPANYNDERFNYFSAIVGSIVPFSVTVENTTGTWQVDTFDSEFSFLTSGSIVNFAAPIYQPAVTALQVVGTPQLPPNASVTFAAVATYDNGAQRDVSADSTWSLDPPDVASISDEGVVTVGDAPPTDTPITITATHQAFEASFSATLIGEDSLQLPPDGWNTFQGNSAHSGYVSGAADPEDFTLRWQKQVATRELHQVAAADGRVFVSIPVYFDDVDQLFALDAIDGEILWHKGFGDVYSVNPPAFAYGNVYVQTGKPTSGSPLLHALNSETGDTLFSVPFAAQWERYLAPTVIDGGVYVNGGTYGGMYRFNAFSGQQAWFESLPQYDGWTPALTADTAYGYVGGSFVAVDRETGEQRYALSDPNFDWNGYDMRGAVALSGDFAVAMHNQRIVTFNTANPAIEWDLLAGFTGQPAVADGVIFALSNDALVALDLDDGSVLWSWNAPAGESLAGPVIATETHIFLSGSTRTFAVEILSRADVWSFAASGALAIGNDTLYIASASGLLTAIALPVILDSPPVSMVLDGAAVVTENSVAEFHAIVAYEDGRVRDRTVQSDWLMKPTPVASINDNGRLTVMQLLSPRQEVTIGAIYEEGDIRLKASRTVELQTQLSDNAFALRNLKAAELLKHSVVQQLLDARQHELSASGALNGAQNADELQALEAVLQALGSGDAATDNVDASIESLIEAIELLENLQQGRR